MPINYSLSYRKVNIAKLDDEGKKQYDASGNLITETVYKAYATAQSRAYGDTLAFCTAVARKNQFMGRSDIMAVLTNISVVVKENVLSGMTSQCGELGTFRPSLSSKGCPEEDIETFTPLAYIKKAYANWTKPEGLADMKSICTFVNVPPYNVGNVLKVGLKSGATTVTLPQSSANIGAAGTGQIGGVRVLIFSTDKTKGTMQIRGGFYDPGDTPTFTAQPIEDWHPARVFDASGASVDYDIDENDITINLPETGLPEEIHLFVEFEED